MVVAEEQWLRMVRSWGRYWTGGMETGVILRFASVIIKSKEHLMIVSVLRKCLSSANFMKVKMLVAQSCLTLCDPMDCSPSGFSVGFSRQEWVAISFSRGSSQPRD